MMFDALAPLRGASYGLVGPELWQPDVQLVVKKAAPAATLCAMAAGASAKARMKAASRRAARLAAPVLNGDIQFTSRPSLGGVSSLRRTRWALFGASGDVDDTR